MQVTLNYFTPLIVAIKAIRKCYDSCSDNLGEKDMKLLESIIKNDHTSTIEHINYTFEIDVYISSYFIDECVSMLSNHKK